MSRDITLKLLETRRRVLSDGVPSFSVFRCPSSFYCAAPSWEEANEQARSLAYANPGHSFRAEERRSLDGIVAVSRCREWASYGVLRMEDYRHGA